MTKSLALTAKQIEAAREGGAKQLTDGRGLYLKLVFPTRLHSWRFDFKSPATGKRNTLILGTWPDLTLAAARQAADDARRLIANGDCPATSRNENKATQRAEQERAALVKAGKPAPGTVAALEAEFKAERWLPEDERPKGFKVQWSKSHADNWTRCFRLHVNPSIGAKPVGDVTYPELVSVVNGVAAPSVREFVCGFLDQLFSWARRRGVVTSNTADDLRLDMNAVPPRRHRPAPLTERDLREALATIRSYHIETHRDALMLGALLAQRPGNVAGMRWDDLDLEGGQFDWSRYGLSLDFAGPVWVIPSADMKRKQHEKASGQPHVVPLPAQAVEIIKARREANVHGSPFVLPAARRGVQQGISRGSLCQSLKAMGLRGKVTPHGLRATFRTLADEALKERPEALEAQLAHQQGSRTVRAYARASYLEERAAASQRWADYMDRVLNNVVPLRVA
ncbi:site-specific integrase [Mitsuaria sp. GD03876]|uniref:tyrosine-type recombinase/integrase n=1 Tax=Mitsuaria sp. GD03876 TaxID=2975399 RepID=UPI0024468FDE|nr:site-specific integrase [Mitsuaria sp. GD03876]MDH0866619.1 integrase arm-type DNA-binding domain-containing protein [Mitsuaria sp. GD03876]